ncbi:MAG: putative uroporphyrinogen synthase, partial [Actinomycetota bacterium]
LGASPRQFKIAAVGTATAEAVGGADLIPNVQTGRSLGESFPTGQGRILLAVAESAGTDFEVAARGKGWTVDRVTTYRTVSITPTHDRSGDISQADAITFASASSARAWHDVFGVTMPKVVVAIGGDSIDRPAFAARRNFKVGSCRFGYSQKNTSLPRCETFTQ